ncbi:hypothetical protein EJP82_20075 [Paenibacillus anaericanus]|uniref:Uncharacterized protein n=1 Tax=Paenibacillus anaericanus TaxID=170367 RepID=A0A433Y532_9BACL|nr:hypothetical protein [Paenibacillus anaericanus]RUT43418.1 hypothetical protein EJP82_20075 [Paenibacillus anaericanus]
MVGAGNVNSFSASFAKQFENSNRSYAHVSFGYETTAYIPLDVIEKYEKTSSANKNGDRLAEFVSKLVLQLIDIIK